MSQTPTRQTPSRGAISSEPPTRLSRLRICVVLGAVLLAVVGVGAWRAVAQRALDEVSMRVVGYNCQGDGAGIRNDGQTLKIQTAENMRCVVDVRVVNHGSRAVHLGYVKVPVMGPRGGSVIRAQSIDGRPPRGDETGIDAIQQLDRPVDGDDAMTFQVVLVFRPQGCGDGTLTVDEFPQLRVSMFGASREIGTSQALAIHNAVRTPGCADL